MLPALDIIAFVFVTATDFVHATSCGDVVTVVVVGDDESGAFFRLFI